MTICTYCVKLINKLFYDDASVLWEQWQELEDISKEVQLNKWDKSSLSEKFQLPTDITINQFDDLLKLQNCQKKYLAHVKKISILLPKHGTDSKNIVDAFGQLANKIRCQELNLNFSRSNLNEV